ncbi:hypothetical protein [Okeania sp. SIO2C9]|nr:hypothetical protein [Okeania sp. SIO2C9]
MKVLPLSKDVDMLSLRRDRLFISDNFNDKNQQASWLFINIFL